MNNIASVTANKVIYPTTLKTLLDEEESSPKLYLSISLLFIATMGKAVFF